MPYETILYEKKGPVLTLTLNRPESLNAVNPQMTEELHAALDEADADREVRAIILTGAGRGFSAGFDIARRPDGRSSLDATGVEVAEYIHRWWARDRDSSLELMHLWHITKPIIAAVHGWVMGGGFWYALASDITIAADNSVFAQPEVRHTSNTTILFAALAGWKAAHRYGLTGDHFDAAEALRIGMVNEVVPHDQLMEHTYALAKRLALVPEPALRLNKAIAMQGMQAAGLHAALLLEGTLGALAHSSHNEFREELYNIQRTQGTKAYLERRDGPFQPEPMGPRSAKGRAERAKKQKS